MDFGLLLFFYIGMALVMILNRELLSNQIARVFILFYLSGFLYSCNELVKEKLDLERLKSERMQEINWDLIDRFPSPPPCGFDKDNSFSEPCFHSFMKESFAKNQDLLRALKSKVGDTLSFNAVVNEEGILHLTLNFSNSEIDSIIEVLIKSLSRNMSTDRWNPGTKRGMPVSVSFPYELVLNYQ